MIIYSGPSLLDGSPIVVIAIGYEKKSTNRKTGGMVQTYIMRSDMNPQEAVATGADSAVCGDCPMRKRSDSGLPACYVNVFQGPRSVFNAYKRGNYRVLHSGARAPFHGLSVRLGTYGDPAAVPFEVWERVLEGASWTGYTHQWRNCDPRLMFKIMASCDTDHDYFQATEEGWRTFRTRLPGEGLEPGEIVCPASPEGGSRSTCEKCGLCDGTRGEDDKRKNVSIIAHGTAPKVNAYVRTRASLAILGS